MKTLQLVVGLLFIAIFAFVIYMGGFYKRSSGPQVGAPTFKTDIVRLQLGTREYDIPNNYFGTTPGVGCNARTATIDVLLPDYEPQTAPNYEQFWKTGKNRRAIYILLKEDRAWGDIDGKEYVRRQVTAMTKQHGRDKAVEADFDLTSYPTEKVETYGDLFVHYVDGAPQNYLQCTKENSAHRPNSSCEDYFPYGNMVVKVNYPRSKLADWKAIETDIKAMLDRFYVGPATRIMEPCHDTFYFIGSHGSDTIMDFQGVGAATGDIIQISGSSFGALSFSQSGSNAIITYANGTITLIGVNATLLTADDFSFA